MANPTANIPKSTKSAMILAFVHGYLEPPHDTASMMHVMAPTNMMVPGKSMSPRSSRKAGGLCLAGILRKVRIHDIATAPMGLYSSARIHGSIEGIEAN